MMPNKKRILRKMALIGMVVFAVSGLSLWITEYMHRKGETEYERAWTEKREEKIRKYRAYLQETAKKVVKLPADPNIVGQAQARYFEEYPNIRLYLWAMDTGGQFQFGVPREAFARLNRAYDTYQKLIEQEGRFTDRQDFIRRLVQDQRNMNFEHYEAKMAGQEGSERVAQAEDRGPYEHDGLVFSTPFQNERGEMLGNLYLKVSGIDDGRGYFQNEYQGPQDFSGGLLGASVLFLWFLLPTWVYLDAKGRGVDSPVRWSVLTLVSLVFGLAIYLILRPEEGTKGVCQNCGRTTGGEKFCPFCGSPATSDFCPRCGYPARAEWTYCPNCQTAIQKAPEPAPAATQEPAIQPESQA
ncbi:MAG: zinc ribbon domain-containing protein [Acidobacteriia bacterium]|nr:zinc ribbon domain-containing protein [Terriglobia bacterium]